MYRARLTIVAILAVAVLAGTVDAAQDRAPVYTNKPRFRIPFKFKAADLQALGAREVLLYMSHDRGGHWDRAQSVAPDAGKFNFQAPEDGEYWFLVRTLDGRGRLLPETNVNDPELKVVVDTQVPAFRLDLRQTAPGRVQLRWEAKDDNLDLTQLRLEYQQPGVQGWQNVGVVPSALGQTEWSVPNGGTVSVQASISDLAKNSARDESRAVIAAGGRGPRLDTREPIANANEENSVSTAVTPKAPMTIQASTRNDVAQSAPALAGPGMSPNAREEEVDPGSGSFTSHRPEPDEPRPNRSVRIVNTRRFQIGYKLQDVGPSGVSSVELYVTPDDGRAWYLYGTDDDTNSPFNVQIDKEGRYGFAVGAKSGVGLSSDPPQPGDKPAIVVIVDQTPPRLELLPLEQGRGRSLNKILIQWRYEDNLAPAEKPVCISYSSSPQGPWQPISGWIENTGRYVWTVGAGVPHRLFVRIEGRDAAGNTRVAETPDPVLIDLARPSARIIDVESPTP